MNPKILLIDIETAPNLGWAWGKWEQNIIENVSDWYMLSFAYKWLGDKKIHSYALPDFPLYKKDKENDDKLCQELWRLFDEADIVIAHNGDEFDIKKANARFLIHDGGVPSPYKTIDTKKVAKRYFKFDSNKLDELGRHLGVGRKEKTEGFELWKGCMAGDKNAWAKMVHYNKRDVELLEKVYLKLRPWITNFPIIAADRGECRNCDSKRLQSRGKGYTRFGEYPKYQCQDCGAWSKGKTITQHGTTKNEIVDARKC